MHINTETNEGTDTIQQRFSLSWSCVVHYYHLNTAVCSSRLSAAPSVISSSAGSAAALIDGGKAGVLSPDRRWHPHSFSLWFTSLQSTECVKVKEMYLHNWSPQIKTPTSPRATEALHLVFFRAFLQLINQLSLLFTASYYTSSQKQGGNKGD